MIKIKHPEYKQKKMDHNVKQAKYLMVVHNICQIQCQKKEELRNYYNRMVNK